MECCIQNRWSYPVCIVYLWTKHNCGQVFAKLHDGFGNWQFQGNALIMFTILFNTETFTQKIPVKPNKACCV